MVIFLVGLVSMILMRTLRKDYARYSKDDELDDMVKLILINLSSLIHLYMYLYFSLFMLCKLLTYSIFRGCYLALIDDILIQLGLIKFMSCRSEAMLLITNLDKFIQKATTNIILYIGLVCWGAQTKSSIVTIEMKAGLLVFCCDCSLKFSA